MASSEPSKTTSIEYIVQQLARHSKLSPRLAFFALLALLCPEGHALVRLTAPPHTDQRILDHALSILSREMQAILSRLFQRETLVCPAIDADLTSAMVTRASLATQRAYFEGGDREEQHNGPRASSTASQTASHLPQALILPHVDDAAPSAQIALLEVIRDGKLASMRRSAATAQPEDAAEEQPVLLPEHFLCVAIVANQSDWGGLSRQLADRIAISTTFTLADVGHLEGGGATIRPIPLEPLLPALPPLSHPLRLYIADLLSAMRMHQKAPRALLTARAQRFLPELVARRAALAGHEPSPVDVRFVLESACGHRLPFSTAHEIIEHVIDFV